MGKEDDESLGRANAAWKEAVNTRLKAIRDKEWAPLATIKQNAVDYLRLRPLETSKTNPSDRGATSPLTKRRDDAWNKAKADAEDSSKPTPNIDDY